MNVRYLTTSLGFSVLISTLMGPRGDSPASCEKETCPAQATCLLRQKVSLFFPIPERRTVLAAARMCSRWSRLWNLISGSWLVVFAWSRLPLCWGFIWMFIGPNMFSTASRTFCSLSVGFISASMCMVAVSILVPLFRGFV